MFKHLLLLAALAAAPAAARPFTADDLVGLRRIAEPAVSPDGRMAAFALRETDLAANRGRWDVWLLDLAKPGAMPQPFQTDPANDSAPAFAPDGKTVYFLSSRGGSAQVWAARVAGGAARKVTDLPVDVGGFSVAPTGDRLAIWAEADTGCADLDCAAKRAEPVAGRGSARTYDRLFARHWDSWAGATRSRLFTVRIGAVPAKEATLVSGNLVGDVPSKPSGGGEEIAWSPDGRMLYFALREAGRSEPWSTNLDIFAVPADGSKAPDNLTPLNKATDTLPAISPDGRTMAYAAMARPGYEADKLTIWLRDLKSGAIRPLAQAWDRSVDSIAWSADGGSLYVTANSMGAKPAFKVDSWTGKVLPLTTSGSVSAVVPMPRGALITMDGLTEPADLFVSNEYGALRQVTNINADKLAGISWARPEQMRFEGANGDPVYAWVLQPPGLKPGQKAPLAFLVHGGPQSSFGNGWSYRWNPQVWAGAGYAVVMVDFHGSTGYGQAFTDSINNDWGGKPLEDLKRGLAAAGARYPWIDTANACAAGGSYGGFMMNWIAGQWPDGFKCLVNHAGIFDQRSMYYGTEELWFPEWEFGGPYFARPENYERWNPATFVTAWKTPMLVIHGQLDFRVPYLQGLQSFTALQRQGIDSRLVVFPDEHHWILKPQNSLQWHREALGWLDRHLKR